jgi:preprotein translocase subunit Sec61beta
VRCVTLNNVGEYSCPLNLAEEEFMSRRKRENQGPMPAASAGLLRFFEEETEGVKVRPEFLVVAAVAMIVVSTLANVFW